MEPSPSPYNPMLAANVGTIYDRTVCPFDPTHTHKGGRHSVDHVFRCRQQHPELAHLVRRCSFNASHWIRVDLTTMEAHLEGCAEFKQWIFTQSANGGSFSLNPRDLVKKSADQQNQQESPAEQALKSPDQPPTPASGSKAPKAGMPAFMAKFIAENKQSKF